MKIKSETMQNMYPEHLMLELFGTTTPSIQDRTQKFFDIWMQNIRYRYQFTTDKKPQVLKLMSEMGMKSPWHYQLKGTEIRFSSATDLAQFKLAWCK